MSRPLLRDQGEESEGANAMEAAIAPSSPASPRSWLDGPPRAPMRSGTGPPGEESADASEAYRRRQSLHVEECHYTELDGHVYSTGMMSIIIDISLLSKGASHPRERIFRLIVSLCIIILTVCLQIYLVTKVKTLVCAQSVHRIRGLYSEYQEHMYQETYINQNGHSRGVMGTWRGQEAFDDLDDVTKMEICQFPLSQPDFAGATLLIWSISCSAEMRRCLNWMYRLLWLMKPSSLASMYVPDEDGGGGVVGGLHLAVKGCVLVMLSTQIGTAMYLLWVGCRWLLATPSFSDLILNGLALTFIVELKEMLYQDMLPKMFHIETERLRVMREAIKMDNKTLATPFVLFFLCLAWVGVYMVFLQQVLPDYRWDVRSTCADFLENSMLSV